MSAQHTPTPWHCSELFDRGSFSGMAVHPCHFYFEGSRKFIKQAQADAEHIVKCVNAHDELVEALKKFVDSFKSLQREKCDVALVMARQAIAKTMEN